MAVRAFLLLILLLLGACNGGGRRTKAPAAAARCTDPSAAVVEAIASGLTVSGGGSLRSAAAVKSQDFESVWFISADIEAAGLEDSDDIATWATNRLTQSGLIFSVDAVAKELSKWPDGGRSDAQLAMDSDGADESRACASKKV